MDKTIDKKLCGSLPMFDKVVHADAALGWTFSEGDKFSGCMVFDYFSPARPTTLTYADADDNIDKQTIWKGAVGAGNAGKTPPDKLASWSGSGSRFLTIPAVVKKAISVTICWDMTGSGNHIIQTEDDTAGTNLELLTNTLGSEDKHCKQVFTIKQAFIQVLAEDPWTISITGYKTG